uniref:exodeoxyribonuclease III n=1 Tax=Panthera tigris altaica TaxID=74533 RepID=A0A8C9JJB0_PANTA
VTRSGKAPVCKGEGQRRFCAFCSGSFRLCCPREHITMSEVPRAETFVFLDLEATGLPSIDPEVAEISLFAVHRSSLENPDRDESGVPVLPRVLDKLTLCMSPERPFTAKASEITGLSSDSLARCRKAGFDSSVVRTLQAFLSRQEGPVCLVAHNGFDYDFPLLCTELRRLGHHTLSGSHQRNSLAYEESEVRAWAGLAPSGDSEREPLLRFLALPGPLRRRSACGSLARISALIFT